MKEKVTISLDICIPEHCYECPFWAGERFKHNGMTICLFPQIPEWGRSMSFRRKCLKAKRVTKSSMST